MSDVMSVRLHLSGLRVRGVLVDSVDRLDVEVESTREWSRCPQCGFRCRKVWDRRPKRVRDLEVSGRRTTLVWRRRRFCCGNCGERHLEDHAQFRGGLTRRFVRRLVRDARVMSIRAVSRHHGVGWHRIMGLVRAEAARVAERRRARPTRVLLVDETSIRRRHRYVTVVASGDSGEVLAMIPGRTKGSLSRFFRDQGADWCRGVEIVVSDGSRSYHPDHRAVPARRAPRAGPLPRGALVHRRSHPGTAGDPAPPTRSAAPNIRTCSDPTCSEPTSFTLLRRASNPTTSATPTRSTRSRSAVPRSSASPHRVGSAVGRSSTGSRKPTTSTGPTRARWFTLGRFADLYATGQEHLSPRLPRSRSSTRSSPGEHRSWPTTPADEHPTDPSKGSTTYSRSYAASLTGSPTTTTTQPEDSL